MKAVQITALTVFLCIMSAVTFAESGFFSITESSFDSTTLNEEVALQIALPEGYEKTSREYPVLYLLDGNFFMYQAVSAIDFLSTPRYMNAVIPSFIVVGVTTEDRNHDLTPTHDEDYDGMKFPTSGGAENFHKFLVDELQPFVDSHYRTSDRRVLAGWSLGGLFTTWTYLITPDSFDSYLAISPSLWWDDQVICELAAKVKASPGLSSKRLTVTLGGLERAPMDESVKGAFLPLMEDSNGDSLFEFVELEGEGHNTSPLIAFHKGLVSLHRMTMIHDNIVQGELEALKQHLIDLAGNQGFQTGDSEAAGQFLIKQTVSQGSYEVGIQIAKIMADRVSGSPRSMVAVGEMAFRLNLFDDSIAAFKSAIAREEGLDKPDPEELKYFQEYLEWVQARVSAE